MEWLTYRMGFWIMTVCWACMVVWNVYLATRIRQITKAKDNPMKEPISIHCCRKGCMNSVLTEWPADFAPLPWILTWHGEHGPYDTSADPPRLRRGAFCSWGCLRLYAEHAGYDEPDGAPLNARQDE